MSQIAEAVNRLLNEPPGSSIAGYGVSPQFHEDIELLARHYLATHAEGERVIDEPITEEWLREIGFNPYCGGGIMHREGLLADLQIRSHGRESWTLLCGTGRLAEITTRLQLLHLLSALSSKAMGQIGIGHIQREFHHSHRAGSDPAVYQERFGVAMAERAISTTSKGPCDACGTQQSATFYTISLKRLFVILCPFCFGTFRNEIQKHDEENSGF